MNNYIRNTFMNILKLVLANLGILMVWQILYFALYTIDSDSGLAAVFAIYDIMFFSVIIWISMVWCALAIVPGLIGFLVYRKSVNKIKPFIGFVTGTFVMLGIYVVCGLCLYISMMIDGLNVWTSLIPVAISAIILIPTMIKTYSSYKRISTTAYVGVNPYPANVYNYGYNNGYTNGNYYATYSQDVNPRRE